MKENKHGEVTYIPIRVSLKRGKFDLFKCIQTEIARNGEDLKDGDIIIVSSKFVSMSQGRLVKVDDIIVNSETREIASRLNLTGELAELILRESEVILNGVPGFVLSIKDGVLMPNAGIDYSNVKNGFAILSPRQPFREAERIRIKILLEMGKKVGIIITDSRLMPLRIGTTGIALGVSGFDPIKDERGKKDLFGNVLRVTIRAFADEISGGAQLLMGETDEKIPIVIVRDSRIKMLDKPVDEERMMIDYDECIYVRGLA